MQVVPEEAFDCNVGELRSGAASEAGRIIMPPEVVNMKTCDPPWGQSGDVRIDRGTIWGNPFRMYTEGDREHVIGMYERWLRGNQILLKELPELAKARRIGCVCKPRNCHGDILLKVMKEMHLV